MNNTMMNINKLEQVTNSYELFEVINHFRVEVGKEPMKHHRELLRKIKDEIGDLHVHKKIHMQIPTYNGGSRTLEALELDRKSIFLVGMRESKEVRSLVYTYLTELEERQRQLNDLIANTFKQKAWVAQEFGAKAAGIEHPRKMCEFIKRNPNSVEWFKDKGYFVHRQVGKSPSDKAWMWSQVGFEYLITNRDNLNTLTKKRMEEDKLDQPF